MKPVKAKIVAIDKVDDKAGANSESQAGNIDQSVYFMAVNISPGDFKIIFQHIL
jgi:hypothetical protein